jgi:NADH dehydrogenase/NADH:ubiquinone oxidoreductase subunit G
MTLARKALLLLLTAAPALMAQQQSIDQIVDSYPRKIPGARTIETYSVTDAKHVLVHIRQMHLSPGQSSDAAITSMSAIEKIELGAVQQDIYDTLSYLVSNKHTSSIYREGLTLELVKRMAEEEEFEKTLASFDRILGVEPATKETEPSDTLYLRYNAVERLLQEKKITQLPAEKAATQAANLKVILDEFEAVFDARKSTEIGSLLEKYAPLKEEKMNDREDVLLGIISDRNDPLAHTVYGAKHDWRDNIQRWNALYPNNKFALIVITPTTYQEK